MVSHSTMKRALKLLKLTLKDRAGQRKEIHISTRPGSEGICSGCSPLNRKCDDATRQLRRHTKVKV